MRTRTCLWAMLLLVLFSLPGLARAEEGHIDKLAQSVVKIYNVQLWTVQQLKIGEDEWPFAFPQAGHGSGTIISEQCLIMTNRHVVEGSVALAVKIEGYQNVFPARVVMVSETDDLAFILIDSSKCQEIAFDLKGNFVESMNRGDEIGVLGYPQDPTQTSAAYTKGVVSRYSVIEGLNSCAEKPGCIQTDTAINPGNSGGPACTKDGKFAGVVVARSAQGEGMGYIIPAPRAMAQLRELEATRAEMEARDKLRGPEKETYALIASLSVKMIESWARPGNKNIGELLFETMSEWMNQKDKINDGLTNSDIGPEVQVMFAGVYWNFGVLMLITAKTDEDKKNAILILYAAGKYAEEAQTKKPSLGSNSFVQAAVKFKQAIDQMIAENERKEEQERVRPQPQPVQEQPQERPRPQKKKRLVRSEWIPGQPDFAFGWGFGFMPTTKPETKGGKTKLSNWQFFNFYIGATFPIWLMSKGYRPLMSWDSGVRFDWSALGESGDYFDMIHYVGLDIPMRFNLHFAYLFAEGSVVLGTSKMNYKNDWGFSVAPKVGLGLNVRNNFELGFYTKFLPVDKQSNLRPLFMLVLGM